MILLSLVACLQNVGPGPDVGACAKPPEGTFSYGEIGIGTCLAGPVDLGFVQTADGRTLLSVANADPFLTFTTGSLLLVDLATIDLSTGKNTLDSVGATAIDADRYAAGLGWLPSRNLMLLSGKFSPDAQTSAARDDVEVFDLADPDAPAPWGGGASITVEDDPVFVRVDGAEERAYVVNVTDHSVTVLDTTTSPIRAIDVAGEATILPATTLLREDPPFGQAPGGATLGVDGAVVLLAEDVPTDSWTLSWVDGTYRVWTPGAEGLVRQASGGDAFVDAGGDEELSPSDYSKIASISEPFSGYLDGFLVMFFVDGAELRVAFWDPALDDWSDDTVKTVMAGRAGTASAEIGGASVVTLDSVPIAFFEGREDATSPGSIFRSELISLPGTFQGDAVLSISGASLSQPFVLDDGLTGHLRLWATRTVNGVTDVVASDSADLGFTWSTPVAVTGLPADVAAPTITYANGRYLMFASHKVGERAALLQAWSADGLSWEAPNDAIADIGAWDVTHPPRPALQVDVAGGFRVVGAETGLIEGLAIPGNDAVTAIITGFSFRVTAGAQFEVDDDVAAGGIEPGSFANTAQGDVLFATALDEDQRERIVILQEDGGTWSITDDDVIPAGVGGNTDGAQSPVVYEEDGGFVMFYSARGADGAWTIHRATSDDGITWDASAEPSVSSPDDTFDNAGQFPHSVEVLAGGDIRLWFTAAGAKEQIATAEGPSDALEDPQLQLKTGPLGGFDDGDVKDPLIVVGIDGTRELWYAGNDGDTWAIGHAVEVDDAFVRRGVGAPIAAMANVPHLFGAQGSYAPTLGLDGAIWFAGDDGFVPRVGRAVIGAVTGADGPESVLFPTPRFPSAGDRLVFGTKQGDDGPSVIELAQRVDGITARGEGFAGAFLDEVRGFLYLPSKVENRVYVVDIRNDSAGAFVDANALDLEALIVVSTDGGPRGFRDAQVVGDRLYLTSQGPDALWVIDLARVVDDDRKDAITDAALAALPLAFSAIDEGVESYTGTRSQRFGAGDMDLSADGRYLWVPEYSANSVVVFDLTLGEYGAEIGRIPYIGEAPHLVRLSPDGRLAFVANYLGEVTDNAVSPTIAVIDADPTSPSFLAPLTWLGNRP